MFRTILIGFFFLQAAGVWANDNSFFAARREALMKKIDGAVAVLQGAPDTRAYAAFRQDNNFYYLTGVETPDALLLLDASGIAPSFSCRLVMKQPNTGKAHAFMPGPEARTISRASTRCWILSQFGAELEKRRVFFPGIVCSFVPRGTGRDQPRQGLAA